MSKQKRYRLQGFDIFILSENCSAELSAQPCVAPERLWDAPIRRGGSSRQHFLCTTHLSHRGGTRRRRATRAPSSASEGLRAVERPGGAQRSGLLRVCPQEHAVYGARRQAPMVASAAVSSPQNSS